MNVSINILPIIFFIGILNFGMDTEPEVDLSQHIISDRFYAEAPVANSKSSNHVDQLLDPCSLKVLYVDTSSMGGGAGYGQSWSDAFTHLSSALAIAQLCGNVDSILVAEGTYAPKDSLGISPTDERNVSFYMVDSVVIIGGYPSGGTGPRDYEKNETILSGELGAIGGADNAYHVIENVYEIDSAAILDGFTISDGEADGVAAKDSCGGGLLNHKLSSPIIQNCVFYDNEADRDGGAIANLGTLYIRNSFFVENDADYDGGAYEGDSASLAIFEGCDFIYNDAEDDGGAVILEYNAEAKFKNCIFQGNEAEYDDGGAIKALDSSRLELVNVLLSGNWAYDEGGAIEVDTFCEALLINVTITGNLAYHGEGGAISNEGANLTIINSIIGDNEDYAGFPNIANESLEPTITYSLIQGESPTGTGNLNGNDPANNPAFILSIPPYFAPTDLGDYRLAPCSELINKGNDDSNNCPVDIDGNSRIMGQIDLGAYETDRIISGEQKVFVDVNATGNNDGSSWDDAFTNLQNALNFAGSCMGDTVCVARGTYIPDRDFFGGVGSGQGLNVFTINNEVVLLGGFAPDQSVTELSQRDWNSYPVILDGASNGDTSHNILVVRAEDSGVLIDGFNIINANAADNCCTPPMGGGILNFFNSALYIKNTNFHNLKAQVGGAIFNFYGSVYIDESTFTNCHAANIDEGGAIATINHLECSNTTFENCSAGIGGAINYMTYFDFDELSVTKSNEKDLLKRYKSIKTKKQSRTLKKALPDGYLQLILDRCTFNRDTSYEEGGAVYVRGIANFMYEIGQPIVLVTNSSITQCSALEGGGMYILDASPIIINSEFISNNALKSGGGVANVGSSEFSAPGDRIAPYYINCTFAGNRARTCEIGCFESGGGGIFNDYYGGSIPGPPFLPLEIFDNNIANQLGELDVILPGIYNSIVYGNSLGGRDILDFSRSNDLKVHGDELGITNSIYNKDPESFTVSHCDIEGSIPNTDWNEDIGFDGGNNIDVDPLFNDISTLDVRIDCGSPAQNAGVDSINSLSLDLAGQTRITGDTIDMGAFETVTTNTLAGPDKFLCDTFAFLFANVSPPATVEWSVVSDNANNSNLLSTTGAISGFVGGKLGEQYKLLFELNDGSCVSTDTLVINMINDTVSIDNLTIESDTLIGAKSHLNLANLVIQNDASVILKSPTVDFNPMFDAKLGSVLEVINEPGCIGIDE